jgi:AcrR family transcriptional regulator
MSSEGAVGGVRAPKRERGRQRVAELLEAANRVFADKGFDAATMTEIAARAGAPIGSLYQFFPSKEALADALLRKYVSLLEADLDEIEAHASVLDTQSLVDRLFAVLRSHPAERAAALPLAEARMDEPTRRATFRQMARARIASILRARAPRLSAAKARDMAVVVLQLMKAASAVGDETGLAGRAPALLDLEAMAAEYLDRRAAPGTKRAR